MSRSLNRVTLIGNVGADPEIRAAGSGRVAQFSVATTRQWTSPAGEKQEKTEWHRIVAWDNARGAKLADIVEKYVKKGDKIYVEGRVEYRQWQDKDNQTRYSTEINANEIILLGGRGGGAGGEDGRPARAASPAKAKTGAPAAAGAEGGDFEEFADATEDDDDLPF
jgi:single-strand DNA-binding protein